MAVATPPSKKTAKTAVKAPAKKPAAKAAHKREVVVAKAPVIHRRPTTTHSTPTADTPAKQRSYDFLSAVGRRKEAVARVRLFAKGSGKLTVNGLDFKQYFPTFDLQYLVLQPLKLLGLESSVDITVKALGGGKFGQAEAVRHGISRALLLMKPEHRQQLRPAGFLTRDARVKERKKPGLKKARRAPQFSKR